LRIGIHAPYLAALGGGEKYILVVLREAVAMAGAEVWLFTPDRPVPGDWERLGVRIDPDSFEWRQARGVEIEAFSEGLDLFVTLENQVPAASRARRSVAVIQFPFAPWPLKRLRDLRRPLRSLRMRREAERRLGSYDEILCYSDFVRRHLATRWNVERARVLYPPVDIPGDSPAADRDPAILSVGRFFRSGHNKKQDVLVRAFRSLWDGAGKPDGWRLHLVGGVDQREGLAYVADVRALADGLPVSFHLNAPLADVRELYTRCSLFWHAAGYGESERRHPERMEHFGIATAEAMAHGMIPLAIAKGGQPEIVRSGSNGFLWRTQAELVDRSRELLNEPERFRSMRVTAARDAARFSTERFAQAVRKTILGHPTLIAAAPGATGPAPGRPRS
jgi:glycosyltransferase involved in cell wall biosynthesis